MTFAEYEQLAARTDPNTDEMKRLLHGAMGVCGEAGEIIDLVKKTAFQGKELIYVDVALEAGDLLWHLSQVCRAIGWSLEEVALANIAKLQKRYPGGFSVVRSNNREEVN